MDILSSAAEIARHRPRRPKLDVVDRVKLSLHNIRLAGSKLRSDVASLPEDRRKSVEIHLNELEAAEKTLRAALKEHGLL